MKLIKLTQGKFAMVDDGDFDELSKYRWTAWKSCKSNSWYAGRSVKKPNGTWRTLLLHRQILGLTDSKIHVDHINHDGLDNQRSNLRLATHQQNQHNQRQHKNNTSGYKGVYWVKEKNRTKSWVAMIGLGGKLIHLGYFSTPEIAALAYNCAAYEYFGEFAHFNQHPGLEHVPHLVQNPTSASV